MLETLQGLMVIGEPSVETQTPAYSGVVLHTAPDGSKRLIIGLGAHRVSIPVESTDARTVQ